MGLDGGSGVGDFEAGVNYTQMQRSTDDLGENKIQLRCNRTSGKKETHHLVQVPSWSFASETDDTHVFHRVSRVQ